MNMHAAASGIGSYTEIVSAIQNTAEPLVSVPHLADLLGVKSTTLNARFRREKTAVQAVGRTNFIPREVALRLARLHKYALLGWLTLKQASALTGVKAATIKARCEAGGLEGHIDLTKRLRISPSALEALRSNGRQRDTTSRPKAPIRTHLTARNGQLPKLRFRQPGTLRAEPLAVPGNPALGSAERQNQRPTASPARFVLPPSEAPNVRFLTRKDYGLPEEEESPRARANSAPPPLPKRKNGGCLSYDPEKPFSVSECAVGKRIRYAEYDGTIVGIVDDPFNPRIKAAFPQHQHPLMREVMLIVGRKKGNSAG